MAVTDDPQPPDAAYVRQRWIPLPTVEWVKACDRIMLAKGMVIGSTRYPARHQAKWRAQRLVRLMVELRLHERGQLKCHTDAREGGWVWVVEYLGREGART